MGKTAKITPIKAEFNSHLNISDKKKMVTMSDSLKQNGYTRFPGTFETFIPYMEKNGTYRTGLDPNALYIQMMEKSNPEEAEMERARVKELKDRLSVYFPDGDCSSKSVYYRDMWNDKYFGTDSRAQFLKLDGKRSKEFDLTDPYEEITWAWMRVHPKVAPSYEDYSKGNSSYRCPEIGQVKYFVDDENVTNEILFKQKTIINGAVRVLEDMDLAKQIKVATLLGLKVDVTDKASHVYNILDTYIKDTSSRAGNKHENVNNFMRTSKMSSENLNIRFLVEQALKYNIYRVQKNGRVYHGEVEVGQDKDAAINHLSTAKYQEDLIMLEDLVKQAQAKQIL